MTRDDPFYPHPYWDNDAAQDYYLNAAVGAEFGEFCIGWWETNDTRSVHELAKEFEMAYNPKTGRYEKGYRLPDGSKFGKETDWKSFLTYEDLVTKWKLDVYRDGYTDGKNFLDQQEYANLLTDRMAKLTTPTAVIEPCVPKKQIPRAACKCAQPKTAPAKGVWKCDTCGQPWKKEGSGWRRIADFVYEEIIGPPAKPRKPRASKKDLSKPVEAISPDGGIRGLLGGQIIKLGTGMLDTIHVSK